MARRALAGALALSLAHPLSATAASLSRAPYVQSVAPASAVVAFRTDADCPASVRVSGEGSAWTASSASGRKHEVTVEGLAPATTYAYAVEACGSTVFEGGRLRTAPVPGTRRVHFAAFADFGTGTSDQAAVVRGIEQADPELVLGAGDVAYDSGTLAEFEDKFFRPMAKLLSGAPLYAAIGNHEYRTDSGGPYLDGLVLPANNPAGSELYYSFDWGHVHFAVLDSSCLVADTARCSGAAQRAWLAEDLAASRADFKIVMMHHPFWTTGVKRSEEGLRRAIAPVLEANGVDLVLAGHDHNYQRTVPMKGDGAAPAGERGIPYVVVGNGGANLNAFPGAQPAWIAFRDAAHKGFLDVMIEGGVLEARMIGTSGAVLDAFRIEKDLPDAPVSPDGPSVGVGPGLVSAAGCGSTGAPRGAASLAAGLLAALALGLSRRLARVPARTHRREPPRG
jgi:hypothetical protein